MENTNLNVLNSDSHNKMTIKVWVIVILLNLVAKIGWAIENSWFTAYVYAEISYNVDITTWMVAVSAAASTVSTLVFGTLSDRIGKRKPFIVWGFICWGLVTFVFAFGNKMPTIATAGIFCIIMDGIMSAIGSIGSDAGYMAWTTDISDEKERATLGAWLGVMPLLSAMVVAVIAGLVVDKLGYFYLFLITGIIVGIFGVFSIFLVKDSPCIKPEKRGSFVHQLFEVFDFKSLKQNKGLLMVLIAYSYYSIIFDAWMPYSTIYMVNYLGLTATKASLIQGGGIIIASLIAIPFTKLIKKEKQGIVLIIIMVISVAGAIIAGISSYFKGIAILFIGVVLLLAGFVGMEQTCVSWMKNLFPTNARGQYEGIRMLFYVAIPMALGSLLSNVLIKNIGTPMNDGYVINEKVFYVFAAFYVLMIIPSLMANKIVKKNKKGEEIDEHCVA